MDLRVEEIPVESTYELRSKILRRGQAIVARDWKQDKWPGCFHLGLFDGDKLVGVLTAFPNPFSGILASFPYQFRGMAIDKEYQRKGGGKILLDGLIHALSQRNADFLWCNSRVSALKFYTNYGFNKHGLEFIIEGQGPHFKCHMFLEQKEEE